jgi:hypothetical protein
MNREDIVRMAREAGMEQDGDNFFSPCHEEIDVHITDLERFAALVAAASEEKWKQTVIDELICCHIYNASHDTNPRKALHDAINWNVQVALDPQVSSDAQELIDRGAAAEREAIAQMIEDAPELVEYAKNDKGGCLMCGFTPKMAAAAIRARGNT